MLFANNSNSDSFRCRIIILQHFQPYYIVTRSNKSKFMFYLNLVSSIALIQSPILIRTHCRHVLFFVFHEINLNCMSVIVRKFLLLQSGDLGFKSACWFLKNHLFGYALIPFPLLGWVE